MSDRATLVQIYIAFYNRAPDPEGLAFWQAACDAGLSLPEIANLFVPQDESIGTYPFLGNPTEEGIRSFLRDVYENLFNREIDEAGETFWTNQILTSLSGAEGGLTIGEVILSIITGAQGDDITTLANKTEVALDFHDQAAALDDFVQNAEATTASRLALSVVDDSDFSVVQGKVLNENYFEEFDGQGNPLFDPYQPGIFDPLVGPNQTALDEAPVNGFILGDQSLPNVAVLADGKVVTVYQNFTGLPDLGINIRNADGSLTLPDISVTEALGLNAGGVSFSQPKIAALPDGGFVIMTQGSIITEPPGGIFALRFDSMGAFQGDPVLVFANDEFDTLGGDLGVTYMPTGNLLYTISGVLDGDTEAWFDPIFRIMTPDGTAVTDPRTINDDDDAGFDEEEVASATLPDGTSLIVYKSNSNGDPINRPDIFGRLIDAEGNPLGQPFLVHEILNGDQDLPQVSALGEDRFVVVFETDSGEFDPFIQGISAVILNRDGSVDVDEFPVNTRQANDQRNAQVTELPNGNFVVVWQSPDSGSSDIRARVFEDDGTPVTDDILVNTFTTGIQNLPNVAATEDGFVVTWQNTTDTIDDPFGTFNIRMAAFDEDGVRLDLPEQINPTLPMFMSGEFQVNDEVNDIQEDQQVIGLTDGRVVFSYFDNEVNQTFFEVRGTDGTVLFPETTVVTGSGAFIGQQVKLAATADGGFVVVGNAAVASDPDVAIWMRFFDANFNGGPLLPVSEDDGDIALDPEVVVDADGNIIVGWTSFASPLSPDVVVRKFDADGDPLTDAVTLPGQLSSTGIILESLAVNDDGDVLVMSEGRNVQTIASNIDVYVNLLDADLDRVFGGALDTDQAGIQREAQAVALENGNFMVVFKDNNNVDGAPGFDISGVIIDGNGDAVGDTFLINTTTNSVQEMPDVITLSDGRILVAWTDFDTAVGLNKDVNARLLTADGTPTGPEFILSPELELNEEGVALAALGDGFAATWQAGFGAAELSDVQGAIFDSDLNPVETPLVLPNNVRSFLSEDDILNLQDIPLSGNSADFFIDSFGMTNLGTQLSIFAPGVVRYDPITLGPEISNLADGDQLTQIFEYTVENADGDQVTLIGSFQVQGYEDNIIPP